jgi:hypothetical protein
MPSAMAGGLRTCVLRAGCGVRANHHRHQHNNRLRAARGLGSACGGRRRPAQQTVGTRLGAARRTWLVRISCDCRRAVHRRDSAAPRAATGAAAALGGAPHASANVAAACSSAHTLAASSAPRFSHVVTAPSRHSARAVDTARRDSAGQSRRPTTRHESAIDDPAAARVLRWPPPRPRARSRRRVRRHAAAAAREGWQRSTSFAVRRFGPARKHTVPTSQPLS